MLGILRDALHRTHLNALRLVEMADALRALVRVDHVDFRAHRNSVVRALGLADVAIDALVGNHQGHAATNFFRKNNTL
ncbi:Integron gene cassette protein [Paraburkholderia tropica]